MRREQPIVARTRRKSQRLQNPEAFLGDRSRVDVDSLIKRCREFLQYKRNRGGDRALGVNGPDIDAGRTLRLPRDIAEFRVLGVEPAVDQPAHAFMVKGQRREEALALGVVDVETI